MKDVDKNKKAGNILGVILLALFSIIVVGLIIYSYLMFVFILNPGIINNSPDPIDAKITFVYDDNFKVFDYENKAIVTEAKLSANEVRTFGVRFNDNHGSLVNKTICFDYEINSIDPLFDEVLQEVRVPEEFIATSIYSKAKCYNSPIRSEGDSQVIPIRFYQNMKESMRENAIIKIGVFRK